MACMITPLSAHTGAEVHGIDLAAPIDEATRVQLNAAFVGHSVLVLRSGIDAGPVVYRSQRVWRSVCSTILASRYRNARSSITFLIRISFPMAGATFRARVTTPTIRTPSARQKRRCCTL